MCESLLEVSPKGYGWEDFPCKSGTNIKFSLTPPPCASGCLGAYFSKKKVFLILALCLWKQTNKHTTFVKISEQINATLGKAFPTSPQHSSRKMVVKLLSHMAWKWLQLLTGDLSTLQAIKGWLTRLYLLSAQDKHLSPGILINTVSLPSLHFPKGNRLPLGTQTPARLKRRQVLPWLGSAVSFEKGWGPLCHGEASPLTPEVV